MKISLLMMTLLLVLGSPRAWSQHTSKAATFNEYYTVSDPSKNAAPEYDSTSSFSATQIFWEFIEDTYEVSLKAYSLMNFDLQKSPYGQTLEPYNRQKHFGTWLGEEAGSTCRNTRAQVLVRDSKIPVTYNRSGCTVATGQWYDPYTNRDYRAASDLQIDHFVPLKNAYVSGADKWSRQKRCLYTNFQGNKYHLLPVLGKENGSKGDRGPEGYMPPHLQYSCEYVANWLKIKAVWQLGITPPEREAIQRVVKQNHCTIAEMSFTSAEFERQRVAIEKNIALCQ